jgi:tryptophan synthase alpha subunit
MLAPTSTEDRIKLVASHATGFIYLVSVTGITGARSELPPDLLSFVQRVRKQTDLPLAIGFGISNGDQARRVAEIANGVIVGSALVRAAGSAEGMDAVRVLGAELAAGSHQRFVLDAP